MTGLVTVRGAACADEEEPTLHRLVIWVPILIMCGGLLVTATVGVSLGFLAAAVILGWSQLAGL
jgi:hypothetical protein